MVHFDAIEKYEIRFWTRVSIGTPDECWEWKCGRRGNYGSFTTAWRSYDSHRFALMLTLGRVLEPSEMALHKCNNHLCCNPDHLYVGDHLQNMLDRTDSSRWPEVRSKLKLIS